MSLDESDWCEIFYLHVDTNMEDVGESLRVIEERIFMDSVKSKIVSEFGAWVGSKEQNTEGDKKVAEVVRNSFKAYEKNKKNFEESYFIF